MCDPSEGRAIANRKLSEKEHQAAAWILDEMRAKLEESAGDNQKLHWTLRRKIYKELGYDERGKPARGNTLSAINGRVKMACAPSVNSLFRSAGPSSIGPRQ